jgi:hypothetical protein
MARCCTCECNHSLTDDRYVRAMRVKVIKFKRLETSLFALVLFAVAFFVIAMFVFPEAFQNHRGRGAFWVQLLVTPMGRWIVLPICAVLTIYTGLAALLRATGRHNAVEITTTGLSVASLWSEHHLDWKEFDRVDVETFQYKRSTKPKHNLIFHWIEQQSSARKKIRVPLGLTDLPADALGHFLDAIDSARSMASENRSVRADQPNSQPYGTRPQFGRKSV